MTQITVANISITPLEHNAVRVVTTKQLATFYGCEVLQIQQNFKNNKEHFIEGKHYFKLVGQQVIDFVSYSKISSTEIPESTTVLMVWTERGAARHAKMLKTEKSWDVFEVLEDSYFKVGSTAVALPKTYIEALEHLLASKKSEEAALLMVEKQAAQIEQDAPKVEFAETVNAMEGSCLVRDFAKVMNTGQNKLFSWLRDQKILMKNNRPYQRYIDNGYFVVKEGTPYKDGVGSLQPCFTTQITGKGQVFLEKKMKEAR